MFPLGTRTPAYALREKITKFVVSNKNYSDMITGITKQIVDFKNNVIRPIQSDFIKHLVSVAVILIPLLSLVPSNLSHDKEVFR